VAEQVRVVLNSGDTFEVGGVQNGCQMMAALAPIIPGRKPGRCFTRNRSEQFGPGGHGEVLEESVDICRRPWPAAGCGGGRARRGLSRLLRSAATRRRVIAPMRFVDHFGAATEAYPHNPTADPAG